MTDVFLLLLATILVNNFVLVQFLGLCPFMGVSRSFETALAMGLATAFVLTLAAVFSYICYHWLLVPWDLEYLIIIVFIVVIGSLVQLTEMLMRAMSPVLHQLMGLYLPLITTNCAVLGVALLSVQRELNFIQTVVFSLGASIGFSLVMVLFAAVREHLEGADIPLPFQGVPIALITAGLMSLAFMGFSGLA